MTVDITTEPLGTGKDGQLVYLKDIWPTNEEIQAAIRASLTPEMFRQRYANVFAGSKEWQQIATAEGQTYKWEAESTYVKLPPLFENISRKPAAVTDVKGARLLALFGDSITTDHISPAGDIKKSSPPDNI